MMKLTNKTCLADCLVAVVIGGLMVGSAEAGVPPPVIQGLNGCAIPGTGVGTTLLYGGWWTPTPLSNIGNFTVGPQDCYDYSFINGTGRQVGLFNGYPPNGSIVIEQNDGQYLITYYIAGNATFQNGQRFIQVYPRQALIYTSTGAAIYAHLMSGTAPSANTSVSDGFTLALGDGIEAQVVTLSGPSSSADTLTLADIPDGHKEAILFTNTITSLTVNAPTVNTGTITQSGTTMTVASITGQPALQVGNVISGSGFTAETITALGTGVGGTGNYTVSQSQTIGSATAYTATYGIGGAALSAIAAVNTSVEYMRVGGTLQRLR